MALETPVYEVLEKEDKFEIRSYAPYIVATVRLEGQSFEQASNNGFRMIADYIFGNNTKQDKVAMTAPVIQKQVNESEKIAMTAPVTLSQNASNSYQVSFVMPKKYTLETLPKPNNTRVSLRPVPAMKMAVLLFSGGTSEERVSNMTEDLKAWLNKKELEGKGEVSLSRYSPPSVPRFMRKNEIAIELKSNPV